MDSDSGTYAFILKCESASTLEVGRLGRIESRPGYYVYIGSAFGPGGVTARLARHFRRNKRKHWHIDYLGDQLPAVGAWYCRAGRQLEHRWANALGRTSGLTAVEGFGSSDCACRSHLFHSETEPEVSVLAAAAGAPLEAWPG